MKLVLVHEYLHQKHIILVLEYNSIESNMCYVRCPSEKTESLRHEMMLKRREGDDML